MYQGKCLIGRQPILNRQEQIFAYELLFRSADSVASASITNSSQATASVIVETLSSFGMNEILGNRRGFINVDFELLMSDAIKIVPKEAIGLDLQGSISKNPGVIDRCRNLKAEGFVIALDENCNGRELEELYGLADIIKIDVMDKTAGQLQETMRRVRQYPATFLAENVDTNESFTQCMKYGFDYFQGYYFARPALVEKKKLDENGTELMQLLRMLIADATLTEIEHVFRSSPGLTYKLLLLVNSVALGMRDKIRDVRHALTILGRQQIKRWVQLSLFSSEKSQGVDSPLVEMATVRAGMMEQLAKEHPLLKARQSAPDEAFLVGILSLLDSIYKISIDEIVSSLNLSDAVREALTERKGVYGKMLSLTEKIERQELGAAAVGLMELGISLQGIIAAQITALRTNPAARA